VKNKNANRFAALLFFLRSPALLLAPVASRRTNEAHRTFTLKSVLFSGLICLALFIPVDAWAQNPFPFVLPQDDVSTDTGNATNLRSLNHFPAGKFGFIRTGTDGHYYAGSERIRFMGVNMSFRDCFPDHATAEQTAGRLARFGVNVVRFFCATYHYPDGVFKQLEPGEEAKNSLTLDVEAMDRLDYFIYQLKQNGIYVNFNFSGRMFLPGDGYGLPQQIDPEAWPEKPDGWQPDWQWAIAMYYPPLIELQKLFISQILSHRNTYTGVTYAQEPAIAFLEVNNEQGMRNQMQRRDWRYHGIPLPQVFMDDLTRQWNDWLRARYSSTTQLTASWGAGQPVGGEMLLNPDFANGLTNWSCYVNLPDGGSCDFSPDVPPGVTGQSVVVTTDKVYTAADWYIQLSQTLSIQDDQPYVVTFWAKASSPHVLHVWMLKNDQASEPLSDRQDFSISTDWARYEYRFWSLEGYANARLNFANFTAQSGTVSLAGISLRPGGVNGVNTGETLESGTVPAFLSRADQTMRTKTAQQDWLQFMWDTERAYFSTLSSYIKTTLGSKALVTGTQAAFSTLNLMAEQDSVDNHGYWEHQVGSGPNWTMKNISMVNNVKDKDTVGGTLPPMALTRVLNKPFSVSEYNHPSPNTYGSEGFPMLAAYAALQDWDAIYAYRWGRAGLFSNAQGMFIEWFDIDQHPNKLVSWIAAANLFRRADVSPARQRVVVPVASTQESDWFRRRGVLDKPLDASRANVPYAAALVHRVAVATDGMTVPADALTPNDVAGLANSTVLASDTGELIWDMSQAGRGVLTIRSPKSKGVIGYGSGKQFDLGDGVVVEPGASLQNGWSVITLTAVEGDLRTKNRLLITASGYIENTGMAWHPAEGSTIQCVTSDSTDTTCQRGGAKWGTYPTLVEGIPAVITLPMPAAGVHAWTLDQRGQRKAPLTVNSDVSGNAVLALGSELQTIWYEVSYNPADLAITQTVNPTSVSVNGYVTYTATITNNGPATASAVTFTDALPAGLTWVNSSYTKGSGTAVACSSSSACSIGSLASGATATVNIMAKVTGAGTIVNTASVSNVELDPNMANNSASASITVVAAAPDLVSTTISAYKWGSAVYVSDTVKNQGNANAGGFIVSYYLSTDASYGADDLPLVISSTNSSPCTRAVTSLDPGKTNSANKKYCYKPKAATGKQYYVIEVIDSGANVTESNETNNTSATTDRLSW